MTIKCGTDLVDNNRVISLFSSKSAMHNVFHSSELADMSLSKLAGIFALKESVLKALELSTDYWLDIEIKHESNGKPYVNISKAILPVGLLSIDCSVSHENNMTLGFVVFMVDA